MMKRLLITIHLEIELNTSFKNYMFSNYYTMEYKNIYVILKKNI